MRPNITLLAGGYLLVEVLLLVWFASAFGVAALIWLLLAGFLLGLLLMRLAGLQAFRALTNAQGRAAAFGVTAPDGSPEVVMSAGPTPDSVMKATRDLGASSLVFTAGLLLAIPGIISDFVGLVLLLPGVQRRLGRRLAASVGRSSAATITVVQADETGWTAQQWNSGEASPQRDRVIRGEVLPPQDE